MSTRLSLLIQPGYQLFNLHLAIIARCITFFKMKLTSLHKNKDMYVGSEVMCRGVGR